MRTLTELKNEWAEAVTASGSATDQAAFDAAWTAAEKARKAYENAAKVDEANKALAITPADAQEMARDYRGTGDAVVKIVSPEVANRIPGGYIEIANKVIVPYASATAEGWVRKLPVSCQHPDILARLSPDLLVEKNQQEEAFALYFRGGAAAVNRAAQQRGGAEGAALIKAFNALQEDTDSEGGYFVPTDQRFEVIRNPGATGGRFRGLSTVFPTTRDGGTWPTATSVTWGGIPEENNPNDSDPVTGQVPFTIHKSGANNKLSVELLSDSAVNIPALLGTLYGEARGRYEDQQGIEGDGSTEPLGLRTTGVAQGAITQKALTATTPVAIDLISHFLTLPEQWRANSTWHMSSSLLSRFWQIGTTAAGVHFVPENGQLSPGFYIWGRPVVLFDGTGWDDAATLTANEVVGVLGDFRQYYFIDRVGMSVSRDDSVGFYTDQIAFKARARYDSLYAIADAFRLIKAG